MTWDFYLTLISVFIALYAILDPVRQASLRLIFHGKKKWFLATVTILFGVILVYRFIISSLSETSDLSQGRKKAPRKGLLGFGLYC